MMKSQESAQIKVISECFIKPNHSMVIHDTSYHDHDQAKHHQQAADDDHSKVYYLGPMDLLLLSFEPMQKGFLFRFQDQNHDDHDHDQLIQRLLNKLQRSLSLSVDQSCFYPLAGQLATQKFPKEHACWIYVDCNKGPGVRLIHATVDLTVSDIVPSSSSADVHPTVRSFFDLGQRSVNHDGHSRPLLSIQVTELLDGVFMGITMNHSVADGATLSHFISTLSKIFFQLDDVETYETHSSICISHKPICKPFFLDGYGPTLKLPYLEPNEFIAQFETGPLKEKIFHFSSTSMSSLKAQANKQCGPGLATISSFQALSSLLWRSITQARNLQPNEETSCAIVANTRQRFDPPLSQHYFGNFIIRARDTCKVGELMGHDLGWAAMLVHNAVKSQDDKTVREFLKKFVEAPFVAGPGTKSNSCRPNSVTMVGSTKFDMYGPEFGMGKAIIVFSGFPNKEDGKVIANPGRAGRGSVDLEICLRPETMNALVSNEDFMSFVSFD